MCPPNRGQPWCEGGGDTLIESQGSTKKSCVGDYTSFLGHNSLLNNTHMGWTASLLRLLLLCLLDGIFKICAVNVKRLSILCISVYLYSLPVKYYIDVAFLPKWIMCLFMAFCCLELKASSYILSCVTPLFSISSQPWKDCIVTFFFSWVIWEQANHSDSIL